MGSVGRAVCGGPGDLQGAGAPRTASVPGAWCQRAAPSAEGPAIARGRAPPGPRPRTAVLSPTPLYPSFYALRLATIAVNDAPRVALALGETLYEVEAALAAHRRKGGNALLAGVPRPVTMLGLLRRWAAAFRDLQRLAKFLEGERDRRAVPGRRRSVISLLWAV